MRLLFVVSEDWYFVSHRLHLAKLAVAEGHQVALLTRVSRFRNAIEDAGVEVIDWQLSRRSANPFREARALFELYLAVRHTRPDLIHAVALKPSIYSALVARLAGARARIAALGGLGFVFSSKRPIARALRPLVVLAFKWSFKGGNFRLILQNSDDRSVLLEAGVANDETVRLVRGAGVDPVVFAMKAEDLRVTPVVVLPARMLWDKGIGDFVACARALKKKGIAASFVLVGDRDEHNPECVSLAQIQAWVAEGMVEWWGRKENMSEVLSQASVVCLPSFREGLPKALLEAASCGRPIVAYDVPGCREVVINGSNGFLVPFRDQDAMAHAIEQLVSDASLRRRMGRAGRELVLKEFSEERIGRETVTIWEELLGLHKLSRLPAPVIDNSSGR